MSRLPARPFLAFGFTILPGPDRVRLVAGEDLRYTLTGPGLETWLPAWLAHLDGTRTAEELLALLPQERRGDALEVLAGLYGERVRGDGPAVPARVPARWAIRREGTGILADKLREAIRPGDDAGVRCIAVLAQARLDYALAQRFNRRCL